MTLFAQWHRYKGDDYHFRRWRNSGWDYVTIIAPGGDLAGWKFHSRELKELTGQKEKMKELLHGDQIEEFQKRQPIFYGTNGNIRT